MSETLDLDDTWKHLLSQISSSWPPARWRHLGVVVGCSGGADSVALVRALCELRRNESSDATDLPRGFLVVAHMNHGLRGKESDADETSVRDLAYGLGVRLATRRATRPQRDEASMRETRIDFLTDTAKATGARYIALAHSADDNVETVLYHLIRGTGPAGLAGIGSPRAIAEDLVLVRPMLSIRRPLIRRGLRDLGQHWREDKSNDDTRYRRNWIRHRLLPLIESEYPHAVDAIQRAIESQRGWRSLIDRFARDWLETHLQSDHPVSLRRDHRASPPVVVAAIQIIWNQSGWPRGEMSREHWTRMVDTIRSDTPQRFTVPGNIEVIAEGESVTLQGKKG